MHLTTRPGGTVAGSATVPGTKSIAHRWLILAATAMGPSHLSGVPASLDVASTASCLAAVAPAARPALEGWTVEHAVSGDSHGFTRNGSVDAAEGGVASLDLRVEGDGRRALVEPAGALDCGNSGTTMRLLAGVLASAPFEATLSGDESLLRRPMERVAEPLRRMGAHVRTRDGRPPLVVHGGPLHAISLRASVPSAQVKGAVLLAGLAADGTTEVVEPVPTRDHTERALQALGAPLERTGGKVRVSAFQHRGFEGRVPGDVSSAAYLVAAAALTGGSVRVADVGLNPTRTAFVDVMRRMGVAVDLDLQREELGEPVGQLRAAAAGELGGVVVAAEELPLVIDEVPVLAALACHARGESRFTGAGELRVKESDRLGGLAEAIRGLGGDAAVDGDDLVVAGGGLRGGRVGSSGDHRMVMAMAVAALAASGPSRIEGAEAAEVSFPAFAATLAALGAIVEA